MKIVIDISEDYFEEIKNSIGWNNFRPYHLIVKGIRLCDVLQEIRQEIAQIKATKIYSTIDLKDMVLEILDRHIKGKVDV